VIERHVGASAKGICEAIVSDWQQHQGDDATTDDAAVLVLVLSGATPEKHDDAVH
jgi:serine phosphatase RsbU (regulator of sigma subunit)